ncbi:MAG: serine/threonine-protein kinase [Kibdelosporangium sp.]
MDEVTWRLVRPLGAGAFGQVHLAWDTAQRRWVAVKHFTGQDELGLLRFVIESRIRVEHPHLVRTVSFRLVDDQAWLVTELARGGSLRPMLDRGPLPTGWVTEVIDQVLDGLTALHAAGVVHRDIKPANLLLRDPGTAAPHVLIGDFGIAAWRAVSMTGAGAAIGTLGYLAPEYLDGRQPSPRTDLFAVGVLAAELLSGRRLVHQSNAVTELPADWSGQIPLPDTLPRHLADVVRKMSDPDPGRRYTDCHAARQALRFASPPGTRQDLTAVEAADLLANVPQYQPAAGHSQVQPPPTPMAVQPMPGPPQPPATRRRRRFPEVVAALAAVAVLGTAGLLVWRSSGTDSPGETTPSSGSLPGVDWTPVPVEPCSRVDIGRTRLDGGQRCQRVPGGNQAWVGAPEDGFPARSNAAGPLPGEPCARDQAQDFSPNGVPLQCTDKVWQARSR